MYTAALRNEEVEELHLGCGWKGDFRVRVGLELGLGLGVALGLVRIRVRVTVRVGDLGRARSVCCIWF